MGAMTDAAFYGPVVVAILASAVYLVRHNA